MCPNIQIFGIELSSYSLLAAAGLIFVLVYLAIYAYIDGHSLLHRVYYMLSALLIGVLGAALLFQLTMLPDSLKLLPYLFTDFSYFYANCAGGIVYYGGLIGAFVGTWLYTLILHLDTRDWLMKIIPAVPLFHTFGRIGCALAGCCYGQEVIHGGIYNTSTGLYHMPIQFIEAGGNLILFLVMLAQQILLYRKHSKNYFLPVGTYLTGYGVMRFILEFFRGDLIRGIYFGLSTSQWISILLVPIGLYCLFCPAKKNLLNKVYNRSR